MATIRAPFNFVPLSSNVYFPEWANLISQDIPFSDGMSGAIELKITAESPIFVRNGHTKKDAEDKDETYKSFSKTDDGRYFIPATSIKGAIRNVLEIMSFGRMNLDRRAMFAQREWDNNALYPLKKQQNSFHCGYLRRKGNDYEIVDYGKPYRIGHDRIDDYVGGHVFKNHFAKASHFDILHETKIGNDSFDPKTAAFKYELVKGIKLTDLYFDYDDEHIAEYNENRLKVSSIGNIRGDIVFTGQPDQWMYPRPIKMTPGAGKFYDFVFVTPEEEKLYSIKEKYFEYFEFIYKDSADWKHAKQELNRKGIPVFFRLNGKTIKDFGLAYLYKLPYDKTPYDLLPPDHKNEEKLDMAECIFGRSNKNNSLKGRVQFSNAFSDDAQPDKSYILTLGSPKASYYPIYISQDGRNNIVANYRTYNDGLLSGWKRYPVRQDNHPCGYHDDYNPNLDTIIYPVKSGATFTGKIRFHNLRPAELGALISAITFHNTPDCHHQLGQGKPYGFGKVKINTKLLGEHEGKELELMTMFEGLMGSSWAQNQTIKELLTMAHDGIVQSQNDLFTYMNMSMNRNDNEFNNAKQRKEYLESFTALSGHSKLPVSLYSNFEEKKKELEKEEQRIQEEKERLEEVHKKEEEERYRQKKLEERKEQGLVFLNETYPNDASKFKVQDFNGAKKRIDQYLKKVKLKSIPEDQIYHLDECLERLYKTAPSKELQSWKDFSSKQIWENVKRWTSDEVTKQIFEKIIN
jgi:CRISPR-associated protein (TIGR03986 family)